MMTIDASTPPPLSAREVSKARHAHQLMEATKAAIHQYGIRGATIDRIQALSGLSRGMINTRFRSKENLLEETVRAMSAEYTSLWQAALSTAGPDPARQLHALITCDFSEAVLNAPNMTLWFAIRSEAQSRKAYLEMISTREQAFATAMNDICAALAMQEGMPPEAGQKAARLLTTTLEGFWVDFHLHPDAFNRPEAIELCWHMMGSLFPRLSQSSVTQGL